MWPIQTMWVVAAFAVCLGFGGQSSGQPVATEPARFVGQTLCQDCHVEGGRVGLCTVERIAVHDRAFETLKKPTARSIAALCGVPEPPTESVLCLGCHSAGAEEGPRWMAASFSPRDGVQCEACHGPGSLHVEYYSGSGLFGAPRPKRFLRDDGWRCQGCHQDLTSHTEVTQRGFALTAEDDRYKTPVDLCVSPNGSRLYVANEKANSISVVDAHTGRVLGEISVGRKPHGVAISGDGLTVYVTCRFSDALYVIDAVRMEVAGVVAVGTDPHGVVVTNDGQRVYVANTGENSVSVIDTRRGVETKRLQAGSAPWGLAIGSGGSSVYATHVRPNPGGFREPPVSEVTVLSTDIDAVESRLQVPEANALQGVSSVPDHDTVLLTLSRTKNLVPLTRLQQGWAITNGLGVVRAGGRVDQVLLDQPDEAFADPMDVAVSPDGRFAVVTGGGVDEVAVVDVAALVSFLDSKPADYRERVIPNHLGLSDLFVVRRVNVGRNPRGIAFSPDGSRAYCTCALDDTVAVIDMTRFELERTIPLGGPSTASELRRGERLFHSADNTFGRQFSCKSCHPDGHLNGLTFDIEADGLGLHPVDNRSLRGILDTKPFKWEGTNPSLARQCGARFAVFLTRVSPYTPEDLQALVRYICTIERRQSRYRRPDGLTVAQRRGKAVFERSLTNDGTPLSVNARCDHCHAGVYKTNAAKVQVGTTMWFDVVADVPADFLNANEYGANGSFYLVGGSLGRAAFDVPHLTDLVEGAPFLHNGAAQTLEEIWTRFNMLNWHGHTSDLTRQQFNDLINYLKAL